MHYEFFAFVKVALNSASSALQRTFVGSIEHPKLPTATKGFTGENNSYKTTDISCGLQPSKCSSSVLNIEIKSTNGCLLNTDKQGEVNRFTRDPRMHAICNP